MPRALRPFLLLLLTVAGFAQGPIDHLALGKMWTFENPPLAYLEREYGFKPDQKWLDSLRLGALRLGELENPWCSASFVSPRGLIMTNHHCVREQIAMIQGEHDWVRNGFAATALADEVPIPGLTVQQLIAQEDVTAKVNEGVDAAADAAAIASKRTANIAAVIAAADAAHPGVLHQVVALYQGAMHQLYRYRVFTDLRLVVAPHLQTAHFGGDPDNFTFPRWGIDFAFLRAWQGDQPADTSAHYFRWRQQGAQDNDLVFVPGNPGNTNRLLTVAQLEVQRDVEYPLIVEQLQNSMAILRPHTEDNPGLLTTLLSWENSNKAIRGMLDGLRDAALMAKKQTLEAQFRAAIDSDAANKERFGGLWDELARLAKRRRDVQPKAAFYSPSYSSVLERGLLVAQAHDASLDVELRAAARNGALQSRIGGNDITEKLLVDHFERAARWLGDGDAFVAAVSSTHKAANGVDWRAAVRALDQSVLAEGDGWHGLLAESGGAEAFATSKDVAVVAARTLWPLQRDAQREDKASADAIAVQGALLGQALHAVFGSDVSPDATMTLRFSDGRVGGYSYNGTQAPWATTFYGLFGRSVEFGNAHPFDLPAAWQQAADKVDLKQKVCFASTNDIVGGNSGSCVVDRDLQVVGLVFDGNIESLPNDFYYTQQRARAVSVHSDAIVQALQHVYGMGRIVDELRTGGTAR